MQCPHCAASIMPGLRSCPQCGQAIGAEPFVSTAQSAASSSPRTAQNEVRPLPTAASAPGWHDGLSSAQAQGQAPGSGVTGLLTQANLHRVRSEWKEATDSCVAVLRAQPGNPTAHSLLGDIYRDQGRLDDAIQWYRMAIELRPNPSDEAKLVHTERERNQLMVEDSQRQRQGYGVATVRSAADADLNAGTVPLMGVSPHRWLRGIWITSLSFLVVALVALINLRPTHHPASATPALHLTGGFSGEGSALPPVRQPGDPSSMGSPASLSGIRANLFAGSQTGGSSRTRASEPPPILQTAPVADVTPLPANALVNAPRDPSSPPSHSGLQPTPLTGGLSIERTQSVGNGTVAVLVSSPAALAGDASDSTRELLLRNLYRAARTGLSESDTYTHATVFIQVPATGDAGEIAIMEATVSRDGATTVKLDTDSAESLASHLTGLKWSVPSAPPTPAPANPPETDTSTTQDNPPSGE